MKLDGKSMDELLKMQVDICSDPVNKRNTDSTSIYIYTDKANKKLDAIGWAITHLMIEKKRENGTYIEPSGYSGRKCKKGDS